MKSKKTSSKRPVIRDMNDASDKIREWWELEKRHNRISERAQARINRIKEHAETKAAPLLAEKMRIDSELEAFAEYNRAAEFSHQKSRKVTFGTLGFRSSGPILKLANSKWNWKKVLQNLRKLPKSSRDKYIKTAESVVKDAIKKDYKSGTLSAVQLSSFGCKVDEYDSFYFEPDEMAITRARDTDKTILSRIKFLVRRIG